MIFTKNQINDVNGFFLKRINIVRLQNWLQINQQYIFSSKMEYHRSPFREKQTNYEMKMTPKRTAYRNQDISYEKQIPHRSQLNTNRKKQSAHRNTFLQANPKHITSQMITEYENQFSEKHQKQYKRQITCQADLDSHHKSSFDQNKKFNAKHFQIQSKLNKIQSFHQKIESLLEIVNKRPTTPSKTSDFTNPSTPQKASHQQKISRSASKFQPQNLKLKIGVRQINKQALNRQSKQTQQIPQQKYNEKCSSYSNKNNQFNLDFMPSNESNYYDFCNGGKATSKFNEGKILNKSENQFNRENKYFQKDNRTPLARAQQQFKESNRKKSKEYMKSIEGEVRDIQNTIELLNQKIKQVDNNSSFKKQIAFDNLSTSNPQSLSDNRERVNYEIEKMRCSARTPPRSSYKQSDIKNQLEGNYENYREGQLKNANKYNNDKFLRNGSTNGIQTPMKYDAKLKGRSGYKNEGLRMNSNPYEGDVEQSQQRNRYTLMQEITRKRS